jgi:hypothetical protein
MRSGWSVGRQLINQVADKTWQASSGNGERRWLRAHTLAPGEKIRCMYVCELRLCALQIKSHLAAARINNVFRVEARDSSSARSRSSDHQFRSLQPDYAIIIFRCGPPAGIDAKSHAFHSHLPLRTHHGRALLSGSRINGAA